MWFIFFLQIIFFIGTSSQMNEECLCKSIQKHGISNVDTIPITTFLTERYNILLQITFEDKMEALDMNYIKIKPETYEIKRKRNGITRNETYYTNIPVGWVTMNITISKYAFQINPYIGNTSSEYPMKHLSIASQYLSSCPEETPSWKIRRDQAISIPLNGKGRNQISLTSESDFSPFITIIGLKYYLTNESGITLGSSGSKLSANTYNFIVENKNNSLLLLYKNEECDLQILASLKLRTFLWNITIGTLDGDFTVVLKPMVRHSNNCESSIMDRSSHREDGARGNTGLLITTLIFGILFITSVTVLMLRVNSPKYAPLFDFLQIKKNTNEDNKDINESGLNKTKIPVEEKLPLTAIANNEVQQMLETRKPETDKFQKQLEEANTESDELRQQLQDKTTETAKLRQQVVKGEAFKILLAIKEKDNLSVNIPIPDDLNDVRDELIGKIFVNGQDALNVFLSIMEMFPDDNLMQSVGMQIIIHMQNNFKMLDKDNGAVEADNDNIGIILREVSLIEKFWARAVLIAIHNIGHNKNSNVLNECLKLLCHSCAKDNIKQTEDMIDECVRVVLKVFEDTHSTDINTNSSLFLRDVNNIEKEYSRSSAQVVRIAHAAAVHIEKDNNPEVVSNCLSILLTLFSKANPNHKEEMVNSHLVKVVLLFLKTELKSNTGKLPDDVNDDHKTGWEILSKAVYQSKTNLAKFGVMEVFDVILQYLQTFQVGAKATETVLGISISIIRYPELKAIFIRDDFMKIIYGILEDKEAANIWVRTFAAELVCRLAEDSNSEFYVMKKRSSKVFFKKLLECMEKNRIQRCYKVDPATISLWKVIDNPQPGHFEAIIKCLVAVKD